MQVLEIIVGMFLLLMGIYRMITHLSLVESERFSLDMQRSSDYGVGIIFAFLIGFLTHSSQIPLLTAVVLYGARKINLRQTTFLLLGTVLLKATLPGLSIFLPHVKASAIGNILIVLSLIILPIRKRKHFDFKMAFLWLALSFRMFPIIKDGMKIISKSSLFHDLIMNCVEFSAHLSGLLFSMFSMNESAGIGISLSFFGMELISMKQAAYMVMGSGVGVYIIPMILLLFINRRASIVFLINSALSLVALLLGMILLEHTKGVFAELFEIVNTIYSSPEMAAIIGNYNVSLIVTIALIFPLLIVHGVIKRWK